MGSETAPKIPVVDLSDENLKPGSTSWFSARNQIRQALEEYGCLEILYHKPSVEFQNILFDATNNLFQLPLETKRKNVHPKFSHGYMGKIPDIHEGLGIEHPTNKDACQEFTKLMWPEGNDHFCETMLYFAKILAELQQMLLRMLLESYAIEKHYDSLIESQNNLLRLLKNRRCQQDIGIAFRPHTDKNFMTILLQNHVNGLDVRTKDGEWIPYVPSSPVSFAVFCGDVCMAWSNDRIKSCHHRVLVHDEDVRYTVGYFTFLDGVIQAPEELVDDEHPLKYKPFQQHELLDAFLKSNDENKRDNIILKGFSVVQSDSK